MAADLAVAEVLVVAADLAVATDATDFPSDLTVKEPPIASNSDSTSSSAFTRSPRRLASISCSREGLVLSHGQRG